MIGKESFNELRSGLGADVDKLIDVFLDDTPMLLARMEAAALMPDYEELREAAHSLKSSSANLGAMALSTAAKRVELGARLQTLDRPAVAVALIAIRPLSGCCECHAPLLSAVVSSWHEIWGGVHHEDGCEHSGPCHASAHQGEKCPSCDSTKDFVKVASPQLAKAAIAWYFTVAIDSTDGQADLPAMRRCHSSRPLSGAGLRAHLVLGVMLI